MADILIRGMEMPKDGRKHTALLQFLEDGKCRGIVEYSKSYDDRSVKVFEVVPLPEGHGRLGDLDRLFEVVGQDADRWIVDEVSMIETDDVLDAIQNAPTIVSAEGGTENDP